MRVNNVLDVVQGLCMCMQYTICVDHYYSNQDIIMIKRKASDTGLPTVLGLVIAKCAL